MKRYTIYTDGACSGNPGPGGIGAVIIDEENTVCARVSRGYHRTTNNRMELLAVIEAVKTLQAFVFNKYGIGKTGIKVNVCSDSQLVVNTITNGWSKKSNIDLWDKLDDTLAAFKGLYPASEVTVTKVKGHADDRYNNEADNLAVKGRNNPTLHDEAYEKTPQESTQSLFVVSSVPEPVITDVKFCGYNTPAQRRVEITLSNGTVVTVLPCHGGFQQTGCTGNEAKLTVDLAWKYQGWLNGHAR